MISSWRQGDFSIFCDPVAGDAAVPLPPNPKWSGDLVQAGNHPQETSSVFRCPEEKESAPPGAECSMRVAAL